MFSLFCKSLKLHSLIIFAGCLLPFTFGFAQDTQELEAEQLGNPKMKGEHPIVTLSKTKNSALRKELQGVHPRVFMTQTEIDALKAKAKFQPELWATAISRVRALNVEPPKPPAEERRVQNEVGLGIAEAAFIYKITGEKKYLDAAKKYLDAAVSYDVWGYSYNKPNVDLAAGHILYGMGWAYDLLYNDLTAQEREKYRAKLIKQARLLYDFFKPKAGKTYAYSQNHTYIPISGLAVTAYALMDETPEAKDWAALSRAIMQRVLETYSHDGYFYESMEYWIFSMPWIIHYLDAHKHATGENLYAGHKGLQLNHKFISHITLPGGEFNFDFGDIYAGPITRARKGNDFQRERINGRFRTNYNILYNLANQYNSGEAQGVAEWVKSKGQVNAEEIWTFIWFNEKIKSVPIEKQPLWHYFDDHELIFWRDSWKDDATAFAFKNGPPEGHGANEAVKNFPEWRLSSGHAHPDSGSFIIWSNGKYLTGDSGYAGVPMTEHHNTLVFDGMGQHREGKGHDVFVGIPYERMNKIRIIEVKMNKQKVSIIADVAPAYEPEVGVKKFIRKFEFTAPGNFVITDDVETEMPRLITSYLHADNVINQLSANRFVFEPNGTNLLAEIVTPKMFVAKVEKNILTAPGRPGSVSQGEREERGVRLAISTKEKVTKARFVKKLTVQNK
jgi:hypothetical protein